MYCTKCGNQISDEAVICPKCGCIVNKTAYDAAFNAVKQQENVQAQTNQNTVNYQPNIPEKKDEANIALCVLAFFIPLFGIIIYIADHKKAPNSTKKYLIWSLVGIGLTVAFYIIYFIFVIFMSIAFN